MAQEKICPHCNKAIPQEQIDQWVQDSILHNRRLANAVKSVFARKASLMREEFRGPDRKEIKCEWCKQTIESARAYRLHKPRCLKNPNARKRGETMPPIPTA